jgi:hypothetical protein
VVRFLKEDFHAIILSSLRSLCLCGEEKERQPQSREGRKGLLLNKLCPHYAIFMIYHQEVDPLVKVLNVDDRVLAAAQLS